MAAPGEPQGTPAPSWNLVEATLLLLRCARQGLREQELLEILGVERAQVVYWLHALEEVIQSQSGVLIFAHATIEESIDHVYSPRFPKNTAATILAAYFSQQPDSSVRKMEEYPHQLLALNAKTTLAEFLSSYEVFATMCSTDFSRLELSFFWRQMGTDQACDRYRRMLESRMNLLARGSTTSTFQISKTPSLHESAALNGSDQNIPRRAFLVRALSQDSSCHREDTLKRRIKLAHEISAVGKCLHEWAEYDDAERLFAWSLNTCLQGMQPLLLSSRIPLTDLVTLARDRIKKYFENYVENDNIHKSEEKKDGLPISQQQAQHGFKLLSLDERVAQLFARFGTDSEEALLMTVAEVCEQFARLKTHKADSAMAANLLRAAFIVRTNLDGPTHKATSDILGDLAWLCVLGKKYTKADGAVSLLKQGVYAKTTSFREKLNFVVSLTKDAHLDRDWMKLFRALRQACSDGSARGAIDPYLPALINRLAVSLCGLDDLNTAEEIYACSLDVHEALFGKMHPAVATVCGDMGSLCTRKVRKLKKASKPRNSQHTRKGVQNRDGPCQTVGDGCVNSESNFEDSCDGSLHISDSDTYNPSGGSEERNALLDIKNSTESDQIDELHTKSLQWFDRALRIRAATLGTEHPFYATILMQKADALMETKDWKLAGAFFEEAVRIREAKLGSGNKLTLTVKRRLQFFHKRLRTADGTV